jgi:hypothetical protein
MSNKLITLLSNQACYPLGLAREIGIEGAIAVSQIVNLGGFNQADGEQLSQRLKQLAVRNPYQVIDDLNTLGVVIIKGSLVILNQEYFQDLDDLDLKVEIKSSIWQDKEFLSLLNKWKLILTAKAVRKSEKDFTAMFEGKDPESVKQALQYSIDNRLVTLYYRENNRGNTKTNSFNRGGGANGGAGERVSSKSEGSSEAPRAVHKGLESLD